uniref:Uncharacterized protein n=1 Tax=Candidatus Kentrum sp. FM TaxID=2126340 RepID=A0A450TW72_9GAMM|nr:MAG: hypothetical protein BECKFM1743A_GA0114220_106124 [Candidatus Kentron sp. FM]VFJ73224.1 MAG: hypothetical protein BECKFM1743C_GA0114222_107123 [Candidatus Kentron sp. FM]VFK20348.1 MAG: hypothetical protein BECKFM1743B_GA0114221_106883 [Candidatus Kentron sp. FM]
MRFTWDDKKADFNLQKHEVSFHEAATVFRDALSIMGYDPDHSIDEDRFVTFGVSNRNRLLVVSHREEGKVIRLISCRLATKQEKKIYEKG